jgi:RNA polymerase sigma-B factor
MSTVSNNVVRPARSRCVPPLPSRRAARSEPPPRRANAPEEDAAFRRYRRHRAPEDREALVRRYMPLAIAQASRYRHTSEPFDDLRQLAALGLLKAIERYDPSRGPAFSSFAVPTILGELQRYFRDTTWSVRVPRDLQELANRLNPASIALERKLLRGPNVEELAESLGASTERVLEAREAAGAHWAASLDAPLADEKGHGTLGDTFGAEDPALDAAEDSMTLELLAEDLGERERDVLRLRFEEDLYQAEIGERLGISQMHVSRLIRQSIEHLRRRALSAP